MNKMFATVAAALLAAGPAVAEGHHSYATLTLTGPAAEGFAALGAWEGSLYVGAEVGAETSGRITDWVGSEDGAVSFDLPGDLREGREMPEGADVYFRLRSSGDAYPGFDMVTPAFEMTTGGEVNINMTITADF